MSEISVVVVGSTSVNSTVGNGDTVNVTIGAGGEGGGAVTIQPGTVTSLAATATPTITNVGTALAQKWNFGIPKAQANSLSVGSVTTGATAAVSISGESPSQTLSFVLQPGPVNSIKIGTVQTGPDAEATLTGSSPSQTLNLVLPQGATGSQGIQGIQGDPGPANVLSIGSVSTGATAAVSISGTPPSQSLSFVLPIGPQGEQGIPGPFTTVKVGTTTTGAAGTSAKVDTITDGSTVTLNFTVPRGVDGTANLADEAPQPLGAVSAGTAGFASRADHVHPLPTIAYTALTGVPVSFAPSAHTHAISEVTNLQAVLDGKQAAGTYATLVNGLVPSSQLPGFVDDVSEFADLAAFPAAGEVGKLFVARDTNKVYRWSGSTYIEIAASPGSTDAVPEGSVNLYYTDARAAAAAPVQSVNGKTGNVTIEAGGIAWSSVPTTTTSTTKAGSISYDADYIYLATAVDTWRRTAVEDWTTPVITITTQPANQTAVGGAATFSVAATVTQNAELTYQWQRQAGGTGGWVNIATGLSATLPLTDLQYAVNNGDKYRVVISSGGAGTGGTAVNGWLPAVVVDITPTAVVTSDAGTLTVEAAISITVQPQSVTLTSDTTASFTVAATTPGTGLAYQWQSSPDGTNWTAISGATSATLSLTGITQIGYDGLRYRCVVSSGGYDDATSNAAVLSVAPITVTTQPASKTATPVAGTEPAYTASFSVAGTSPAGPPSLQWQVSTDAGANWSDVSGATSDSLSLSALTWSDTGKRYRARLTKTGWNEVASNAATLTVPTDTIAVTQQPANTTASVSQFSATAFTLPSGTWSGVSYAGGKWFATPSNSDFGGDYIATSTDGINWTQNNLAMPFAATWEPVQYGGGIYLTYDRGAFRFATSSDGTAWTERPLTTSGTNLFSAEDVKYVNGLGWLAVNNDFYFTSPDGIAWSSASLPVTVQTPRIFVFGTRVFITATNYSPIMATVSGGSIGAFALAGLAPTSVVLAASPTEVMFTRPQDNWTQVEIYNPSTGTIRTVVTPDFAVPVAAAWSPSHSRWIVAATGNSQRSPDPLGGLYTINSSGTSIAKRAEVSISQNSTTPLLYISGSRTTFYSLFGGGWRTSDDGGLTWASRTGPGSAITPYATGGKIVVVTGVWLEAGNHADTGSLIDPGGAVSATFSAAASTTFGSPATQWQVSTDGGANWSDVSGATSPTLSLTPVSADTGKRYRARFTKSQYAAVNSNAAILTVP